MTSSRWSRERWHSCSTQAPQIGHAGKPATSGILPGHFRPGTFTTAHLAYHGAHLCELTEQLVHILRRAATAARDAFLATAIDDIGIASFLSRHGKDYRFHMFQLIPFQRLLHIGRGCDFIEARDHLHDLAQWSHTLQLAHGIEKVLQVKFALLHFGLGLQRLFLVDGFLRAFDQRKYISHSQYTRGQTVGIERLQRIDFFTHAHELDRDAGHRAHRKRRPTPSITIHFGQDHARQRDGLVEVVRDAHRFLTGHGIGHQQHFTRLHPPANADDLLHHALVDVQAARRVQYDDRQSLFARIG